jgi:hypothetical protein
VSASRAFEPWTNLEQVIDRVTELRAKLSEALKIEIAAHEAAAAATDSRQSLQDTLHEVERHAATLACRARETGAAFFRSQVSR